MPTTEVEKATKTNDTCQGCGACCAPGILGQETGPYLEVTPSDLKDEFKSRKKLVVKDQFFGEGGRLFLPVVRAQNDFTQCEHLAGHVLQDARCGCYDTRPAACRIFVPGGEMCQKARQAWLVHRDQVRWELSEHPELNRDEAVFAVVSRNNGPFLGLDLHNAVLNSLGQGPDYVYLRAKRDREQQLEVTKLPASEIPDLQKKRPAVPVSGRRKAKA